MIILGVDPSSTSTGFGVLEYARHACSYITCGCVRPCRGLPFEERLVVIFEELREILARYQPAEAAVERTFFGKDAEAAAKLGHARGVILLALRLAGVPVAHYTPAEVKRAVTGHGRASKQQVQRVTAKLLGLSEIPGPLDASDALAIGLCHAFRPGAILTPEEHAHRPEIDALLRRMIRR